MAADAQPAWQSEQTTTTIICCCLFSGCGNPTWRSAGVHAAGIVRQLYRSLAECSCCSLLLKVVLVPAEVLTACT